MTDQTSFTVKCYDDLWWTFNLKFTYRSQL